MSTEMTYLAYTALFTGLMWVPYILNAIAVRGIVDVVGYRDDPKPLAGWAARMKKAHYNAVENLGIFAALALVAELVGANNDATATAAIGYFWVRIVHFVAYALAIPWVRTLAFVAGFVCQAVIAWQVLTA